jgi:hypothetical protein
MLITLCILLLLSCVHVRGSWFQAEYMRARIYTKNSSCSSEPYNVFYTPPDGSCNCYSTNFWGTCEDAIFCRGYIITSTAYMSCYDVSPLCAADTIFSVTTLLEVCATYESEFLIDLVTVTYTGRMLFVVGSTTPSSAQHIKMTC